jgi:hypothetical protein
VDRPAAAEWLVASAGVEGEMAEQFSVVCEDAYVRTGDQQGDLAVAMNSADRYVA